MNIHVSDRLGSSCPIALGLAFTAMAMLAACAGRPENTDTGVTARQFQDMVVPEGFRLLDGAHQSHSREEGDWRMGRFFYAGAASIADASGYVKQRMPQHNWQLELEELSDPMQGRMRYARGRYIAEYTFQRQEGTTQMRVEYKTDYTRR